MATPTDRPCPAFGTGCGGFLNEHGVCSTCGAVEKSSGRREALREAAREVVDDYFDEPEWHGGYTDADLDALADEAADRHYDRD